MKLAKARHFLRKELLYSIPFDGGQHMGHRILFGIIEEGE